MKLFWAYSDHLFLLHEPSQFTKGVLFSSVKNFLNSKTLAIDNVLFFLNNKQICFIYHQYKGYFYFFMIVVSVFYILEIKFFVFCFRGFVKKSLESNEVLI